MKIDLIVTRHSALIEHLKSIGLADENTAVTDHTNAEQIDGLHVCGVLPHNLSALTASFTEVPIHVPSELRGKELTLKQLKEFAKDPVTYRVFTELAFREGCNRATRSACSHGAPPINFRTCF